MGAQFSALTRTRGAIPIFLALGLYAWVRRKENAKKRRALKKKRAAQAIADAKAGKPPKKTRRKDGLQYLFRKLWPFGKSSKQLTDDSTATAGRFELLAIMAFSVLRTWHINRRVYVKRDLMLSTYERSLDKFKAVLFETVWMSVVASGIYATHKYLKERLSLIWREKLTKQLHQKYFTRMNYYRLSHLNRNEIGDVEERMVKDPRRFCKSLAEEMEKASAAMTSGLWFTYKLTTIASFPYAVSPLIYFYVSWNLALLFAPDWSKKWRKMLDLRAKYFGTQSRLQTHAEAVCAYQGNTVERSIIQESWDNFTDFCKVYVQDATVFEFVSGVFFKYGSHTLAQTMIVGKFMPISNPIKAQYLKSMANLSGTKADVQARQTKASAILFSEIRYVIEYFLRAMSSQGVIIQVLRQLMQMQGPAGRLTELFDTLEKFDKQTEESTQFIDENKIAFENVDVYTPTEVLLLKDLNFSINLGESLLLTGCNGSGKSSIFRCLGGLWKIPKEGVITKPGGGQSGLNKDVFYLPQKPYNVLGTLRAQMLYPATQEDSDEITDEYLTELLNMVDLGYLMERGPQGPKDDKEVDWEAVLSMGEKQRLAMARMYFHKPKFAILDECTSGVSASMEARLYESCVENGITCITISHRPVLEQYHDVVLNVLKDGKGGWDFRMTDRGRQRLQKGSIVFDENMKKVAGDSNRRSATVSQKSPDLVNSTGYDEIGGVSAAYMADLAGTSKEQGELERKHLEDRSAKYRTAAAAAAKGTTSTELLVEELGGKKKKISIKQRFWDVWNRGFMPNGMSPADPEARRIFFLCALVVGKTVAAGGIAFYDGYILTTVLQSQWSVFAKRLGLAVVMRSSLALFDATMTRQKWYLNLTWRKRLTKYMMDLYFNHNTFYDVKNQDSRINDPEERFTEQVEQLSVSLTELWTSLLRPAFDISYNLILLYRVMGTTAISGMAGYMFVAAGLLRFIVPNFRQNVRKQFKLEGRFRFVHTRLVTHTESVAFFGGDDVEHEVCNGRLDELKAHVQQTQLQTWRFNIFNNFMTRQTPDLAAFSLRMYFALAVQTAVGVEIAATGEYIQQLVMNTFKSFGDAFELQETIGNFMGTLENVSDLMYTLEDLSVKQTNRQGKGSNTRLGRSDDGSISFNNVDIVAPGSLLLLLLFGVWCLLLFFVVSRCF
jgi:ABC-type uncharacterized transport system fused permease/ATPase subunit